MLRHALMMVFLPFLLAAALAQEAYLPVPPGIEVHGVPPIPASLAKDVAKYTGAYGDSLAGWDPVKREIRVKLLSNMPSISRIEAPGAKQKLWRQLLVGSVYDLYPDPNERYIIYNKDVDGNEAFQMYLYDLKTYKSALLSDPGSRNTEFVWSHAGDRVVYCRSKASEGPGVSLYVMDPRDPKTNKLLVKSDGNYLKAYDWSPDGSKIVYCEFYGQNADKLWVLNLITGERMMLSPKISSNNYYEEPRFSSDGAGVYLITDQKANYGRLAFVDIASRHYNYLSPKVTGDVDGFQVSPDGKFLVYTINDFGYSKLCFLDLARQASGEVTEVPKGIISNLIWSKNRREVAFEIKNPRVPGDIYSYDFNSKSLIMWSKSFPGDLKQEEIVMPEIVKWKSYDGTEIQGFLYRPTLKFKGKRPVIVFLHGGPNEQYRPKYDYEHNYYLNELGIAWIYPNFRGSTGYGKSFQHSDDVFNRGNASKDIGALLDWISKQDGLDANNVMVRGGSYGGYLALSVACDYSKRIKGVAVVSGLSSLLSFLDKVDISRLALQRNEFGDERVPAVRAFMEKIAPMNNIAKISVPILIIHGKNDPIAPASDALAFAQRAKEAHLPVWLVLVSNEGHSSGNRLNWDYEFYCNAIFAREHLLK